MFVVSKDKNSIVNMSQITVVYLGADNCTIKADYQNGKGCQLGRYNSEKEAKTAIDIIANNMGKWKFALCRRIMLLVQKSIL